MENEVIVEKKAESNGRLIPPRSEQCNELFAAMAKAQGEFTVARKRSENPFFKSRYADFSDIVQAAQPALTKYGLSFSQPIDNEEDGSAYCYTILQHSSGQFIAPRLRITPAKNDIQSFGSMTTYIKRYSLMSLLGIAVADDDDDGERAMLEARDVEAKGTATNTNYNARKESWETISKDQLAELEYELNGFPDMYEQIKASYKLNVLADLPKSKYRDTINQVREKKLLRTQTRK